MTSLLAGGLVSVVLVGFPAVSFLRPSAEGVLTVTNTVRPFYVEGADWHLAIRNVRGALVYHSEAASSPLHLHLTAVTYTLESGERPCTPMCSQMTLRRTPIGICRIKVFVSPAQLVSVAFSSNPGKRCTATVHTVAAAA